MKPLTTQDLRHKIELRRPAEVPDGKGGYATVWTTLASPRAEVQGLDGREVVMDRVLEGISVYRIRIRWRSIAFEQSDQVRWGSISMNIRSAADPDGLREQLVIMADTASVRKDPA